VADSLQDLLDFRHEAVMEDWGRELDDTKVTGTLGHVLFTSTALEVAVDCAKMRIVRTFLARSEALLIPGTHTVRNSSSKADGCFSSFIDYIHRLRIFDIDYGEALILCGREEAELNFLDGAQRRARVGEIEARHDGAFSIFDPGRSRVSCYETILLFSRTELIAVLALMGARLMVKNDLRPVGPPKQRLPP
jgi:hypothetical protein